MMGNVFLGENISMPQTEVTISEWMSFIACNNFDLTLYPNKNAISQSVKILFDDLKSKSNFKYLKIIEAKGNQKRYWGDKGITGKNTIKELQDSDEHYLSLLLPVTGISFDQAERFCKWKEQIFNADQPEEKKIKINLPSIQLYAELIENADSINHKSKNTCKQYMFNYKLKEYCKSAGDKILSTQGQGLIRTDSYWPTKKGLYCLQGNAAEMTSTYGIAMGGSFKHFARESYNDKKQEYNKPEEWLGFRYIVTYANE